MTNAISKLHHALEIWSFKYNCYEAVHPWTPFCSDCALDIGLTVFGEAIKLYTPLYLFSQIIRRKYDYESFKTSTQSILRSTTFISLNAFFALFFFCSSQYFTGKFYYYAVAYIPGFLASAMAVMIEKPSRRSSLAFYVANVASEALFRIYVGRGYIKPIKNGQVYIFMIAMATIMMLAKKHGFDDDLLSAIIKMVVGPEEAAMRRRCRKVDAMIDSSSEYHQALTDLDVEDTHENSLNCLRARNDGQLKAGFMWFKLLLSARHQLCPHTNCSCALYVARSSIRSLAIGYGAQLCLRLASRLPQLLNDPSLIFSMTTDPSLFQFGLFLSTFSALFKATNCCLRWSRGASEPSHCFMAGLVAGPALLFYPSPTVSLYVLWKCLEALFNESVRTGLIRNKDAWIVLLYGLATSQLFYSALMDPRYMKKSYMAFLDKISHHRLHLINRSVLDVFGTQASSGYEDFFPDLHPRFMSRAFLGSVWIWMIEQKFQATQCMM